MSKTVDELVQVFEVAHYGAANGPHDKTRLRAGIIAVVTALRDELVREFERCDCCSGIEHVEPFFEEILAPREGGSREAGVPTSDGGTELDRTSGPAPAAPAPDKNWAGALQWEADCKAALPDPAPAPCLWRVHHETRNGPLYVSQCDGEWRHATADPKCPACKKEIFFVTDPAPAARSDATAVCEWRVVHSSFGQSFFASGCFKQHDNIFGGICPSCGLPIKFTEAK